jgi:hypothetical protein
VLIVLAVATWGVVVLVRRRRAPGVWVLAAWAAYFLVLSGGAHGISRFRHPIVPILCVFAGAGARFRTPGVGPPATAAHLAPTTG